MYTRMPHNVITKKYLKNLLILTFPLFSFYDVYFMIYSDTLTFIGCSTRSNVTYYVVKLLQ